MKLEGTFCALATPFTSDDEIDEEGYRANINFLIENGVDGLVAAGTSGESATITHEEQKNPNVYTQTKNIDFININSLDTPEENLKVETPQKENDNMILTNN